jgi:predicted ribosome quality control (RQC) complex YloA/Tae2 family protein
MKPLNDAEIESLAQDLGEILGAQLQEIRGAGLVLALGLYIKGRSHWLWIDLRPACPSLLRWPEPPVNLKGRLPLALFLQAHGKNLRLSGVKKEKGRVLCLTFGREPDPLQLEIRLFPHGGNVIARKGDRRISMAKVQELAAIPAGISTSEMSALEASTLEARSFEQLRREWRATAAGPARPRGGGARSPQQELESKRRALQKVTAELEKKQVHGNWAKLGEWLKENQSLEAPAEFSSLIDPRLGLAENIERAFEKAKALKRKFEETRKRKAALEEEIEKLSRGEYPAPSQKPPPTTAPASAKYRTLKLDASFEAYMGKSGRDNLALLREAQPWDLWLHLRDLPGAHVIVRRPKYKEVPAEMLDRVIAWLVKESAPKKFAHGDIVEVQMQEARYVRPIKGDKWGRVTVQDPKHRRIRLRG